MRIAINWKSFFILSVACVIGAVLVVPFQIALVPAVREAGIKIYFLAFLQGLVIFPVVVFLGLFFAGKIGFGLPVLEGENKGAQFRAILKPSLLWGLAGGVLVVLFSLLFWDVSLELLKAELAVPAWAGFLAGFYGGIAEEVLFRLFLTSLFVWILMKLKTPKNAAVWITIILTNVLFGLGHLGITGELTAIGAEVVARAILLNSTVGVICGWLYWKKGLEAAMTAHFSADMVLHVITPLAAGLFM